MPMAFSASRPFLLMTMVHGEDHTIYFSHSIRVENLTFYCADIWRIIHLLHYPHPHLRPLP